MAGGISTLEEQEVIANAGRIHEPPVGYYITTREDQEFWKYLMGNKPYAKWKPTDLVLAGKIMEDERMLRVGRRKMAARIAEGADPFEHDTPTYHYQKNMRALESSQMTKFRALGVMRRAISEDGTGMQQRLSSAVSDAVADSQPQDDLLATTAAPDPTYALPVPVGG